MRFKCAHQQTDQIKSALSGLPENAAGVANTRNDSRIHPFCYYLLLFIISLTNNIKR